MGLWADTIVSVTHINGHDQRFAPGRALVAKASSNQKKKLGARNSSKVCFINTTKYHLDLHELNSFVGWGAHGGLGQLQKFSRRKIFPC